MKKNIFFIAIGLALTCLAFSQRPKFQKGNPEFKKEMQNYIEQNIVPVLQKKQTEFDSKLSAEDRAFIQAKRTEAKEKREQHHAERKARHEEFKKQNPELLEKRKAIREEWKNMTEEEKKAKKEEWKNMTDEERQAKIKEKKEIFGKHKRPHNPEQRAERKAMMMEMKEFMMRNQDLVKTTMEDLKPLYQKWTTDQVEIIKKYHPEKAEHLAKKEGHLPTGLFGLTPKRHQGKMHKRGMRKGGKDFKREKREGARPHRRKGHKGKRGFDGPKRLSVMFVLWDGSTPPEAAPRTNEPTLQEDNLKTSEIRLGQNFPNPAKSITRIQVDLPNNMANLDLTITDLNGKMVKQINLSDLNAGTETIELNVSDLPNGQYFYTIEGKGIKTTKKMTVNH